MPVTTSERAPTVILFEEESIDPLVLRMLHTLPLIDLYYEFKDFVEELVEQQRESVLLGEAMTQEGKPEADIRKTIMTDDRLNRLYLDRVRERLGELVGTPVNYTQADEFNSQMMYSVNAKKKRIGDATAAMQSSSQLTATLPTD